MLTMTWIVWLFSSIINHNALLSSISLSHSPSSNHSSTIHQFNHNNNNNNNNNPFIHCFNHFIILLFISTSTQSLQLLLHFNPSSLSHTQKLSIPQQQSIIFDTSISTSNPISLLFNILSCFNSLFINNHSNLSSTIHSIMVSCAFCLHSIQSHSLHSKISSLVCSTSPQIPSPQHTTQHTFVSSPQFTHHYTFHTHTRALQCCCSCDFHFLVFHNQCPTAFPFVHHNIHITLPLSTSFILLSVSPSFKLCNDFCFSPALF